MELRLGTFEDTFGSAEVWHELLDPIFGHPVLTAAYFEFYKYFLKGTGNGGLATGFCTSLAVWLPIDSGSGAQTPRRSSSMPSRRCSPASTGNC